MQDCLRRKKGMKKLTMKLALLLCLVMVTTLLTACGGDKEDDSKKDAVTGTWKQTDEMDGATPVKCHFSEIDQHLLAGRSVKYVVIDSTVFFSGIDLT